MREEPQSLRSFPSQREGLTGPGIKADRGRAKETRHPGWWPAGFPELCPASLLARRVWLLLWAFWEC